jgi:diketogulonate reductase-like aldo/keto reductase
MAPSLPRPSKSYLEVSFEVGRLAIVGAREPQHIEASIAAADIELTSDDLAEIDRITADAVQVADAAPQGIA